jgi:hypothetical protein
MQRVGNPPTQQPTVVILSAKDGKILANLPLAGGSDGAALNPATMEAFSTQGCGTMTIVKEKSPTSFDVEQNLQTMNGARTIAFDSRTGYLFTMSQERGPAPLTPATQLRQQPTPARRSGTRLVHHPDDRQSAVGVDPINSPSAYCKRVETGLATVQFIFLSLFSLV